MLKVWLYPGLAWNYRNLYKLLRGVWTGKTVEDGNWKNLENGKMDTLLHLAIAALDTQLAAERNLNVYLKSCK